ncbi:MAG: hypothetical protein P8Q98_08545, partial [Candidatus Poseidoniaceae archaeon]|nr:hypothetical protein [Candidatus Poseidoniaceae archaeon]
MEGAMDMVVKRPSWHRFLNPLLFGSGMLASVIQPIFLLASGKEVNDAIWPHAYRALQATMFLRDHLTLMFFFSLILFFSTAASIKSQMSGKPPHLLIHRVLLFISGLTTGFLILYFLLDVFYLRGAFLLLPTAYGIILLCSLFVIGGLPRMPERTSKTEMFAGAGHIFAIFFAA